MKWITRGKGMVMAGPGGIEGGRDWYHKPSACSKNVLRLGAIRSTLGSFRSGVGALPPSSPPLMALAASELTSRSGSLKE